MTFRKIAGYGLLAGLAYGEMLTMRPGEILDYYIMRRRYDDALHGVQRE